VDDVDNASDAFVDDTEDTTNETAVDPYEQNITIEDINIVTEMNTSQLAIQQLEEEQNIEQPIQTHGYSLRARPTKRRDQMLLAITDDVTGVCKETREYITIHPKVHAHVMLTQMNVRQGLLLFGEKGNEAITKELKQLHEKRLLIQCSAQTCQQRKGEKHCDT